jgi:restriction endonuclease Mrr
MADLRAVEEAQREENLARSVEALALKHGALIDQFLEIAERKVSLRDEYGDEQWEVLAKEVETAVKKIASREGAGDEAIRERKPPWSQPDVLDRLREYLREEFEQHHDATKASASVSGDHSAMSGPEFEAYLARLLEAHGAVKVRGTPATGDQGADLLLEFKGRQIVLQAKRYSGAVGNKAVQETASAVAYYGAHEGWVVTNARFTKSARQLAQRTRVRLIDGIALADLESTLRRMD